MPELDVTSPYTVHVRVVAVNPVGVHPTGNVAILVPVPGAPGQSGPPGDGAQVFGETPTGLVDGVNAVYTTAEVFREGCTEVFLNGLREHNYTETDVNEITFEEPPWSGDDIRINYIIEES